MDFHMADELVVPLKFPGHSVDFLSVLVLGRVEELLVAEELWNDHKKPFFFPFSSAATCTNHPLEVDQRAQRVSKGSNLAPMTASHRYTVNHGV
ncbi:hypothetical protein Taro_041353 [Colocasia esculenta]|uniref:Uncharacterized protein n=1 Tax=Colocasia esculenta TaxID=4460 RepID=A0A843WB92_COLES|nr:hypothetical protein [Colocasia esculenta]